MTDSASEIRVYHDLAARDGEWADATRRLARRYGVCVLNLIGSPGCGKTALVRATLEAVAGQVSAAVLEGDIATTRDAERLADLGIPVSQILTDGGCHLPAQTVHTAFADLPLADLDLVVVENVGNLVCPACFDIGEDAKVAVLSVTEGEEKPVKYPRLFLDSQVGVLTKIDLLPHIPFDIDLCRTSLSRVNSHLPIFELSVVSGTGIPAWLQWVANAVAGTSAEDTPDGQQSAPP